MKSKNFIIPVFATMVLLQLAVPGKMIWDREVILESGKEFKFKTRPIDPNDPFRGKFVVLDFLNDEVPVENAEDWIYGTTVYAIIGEDEEGFVRFTGLSKTAPKEEVDYLKTKVEGAIIYNENRVTVDLPFNRLYMDEYKAPEAERLYRESQVDTTTVAYGLVAIKDGRPVLKDVMIDGVSIRELVKQRMDK